VRSIFLAGLGGLALIVALGIGPGLLAPTRIGAGTEAASPQPGVGAEPVREVYARALAAYYLGEYDRAEALFMSLESRLPPSLLEGLSFWKGECAFRQGQVEMARSVFEECLRRTPHGIHSLLARQRLDILASLGR